MCIVARIVRLTSHAAQVEHRTSPRTLRYAHEEMRTSMQHASHSMVALRTSSPIFCVCFR
jgi:hypothetical protein